MQKAIHKVEVGDLVRSVKFSADHGGVAAREIFMVMEVTEPVGYQWYRGSPLYTHEISLKLWEIREQPNHTHWAQSNLYEIV